MSGSVLWLKIGASTKKAAFPRKSHLRPGSWGVEYWIGVGAGAGGRSSRWLGRILVKKGQNGGDKAGKS